MHRFALIHIEELDGKLKIFKLQIDGDCPFDAFEAMIEREGNLRSELITIQTRLQEIADLRSLPQMKFKDITPKKEIIKEYEIKTGHLRVYLFHDKENGRVIVCGGKKSSQPRDIRYFRKIKKAYFNTKAS